MLTVFKKILTNQIVRIFVCRLHSSLLQFVSAVSNHFRFPMIEEKFQIGDLSRFKSMMKIVLYFMVSLFLVKKMGHGRLLIFIHIIFNRFLLITLVSHPRRSESSFSWYWNVIMKSLNEVSSRLNLNSFIARIRN